MRIVNLAAVTLAVVTGFAGSMTAAQAMTAPSPLAQRTLSGTALLDLAATHLTVTYRADQDARPMKWHLQCDPPGGDHPQAQAACAALTAAAVEGRDPFAAPPKDQMCTFVYGGPQTATVEGTWQLTSVSASFTRTNGCETDRWNAIAPVLEPAPAG